MNKETAEKYTEIVTSKFSNTDAVQKNGNVEEMWKFFRNTILEAAKQTCGSSRKTNNKKQTAWWSEEIRTEIKCKKDSWKLYINSRTEDNYEIYKQHRNKVKELVKAKKRKMWSEFGEKMENDSKENQKLFYKTLKSIRKGSPTETVRIKDKSGNMLIETADIMKRWREYFQELLQSQNAEHPKANNTNKTSEENSNNFKEDDHDDFVTEEELQEIISKLKNGKTPGWDKVTTEMFKCMGKEGVRMLLEIYNRIWNEERIPQDWKTALIVPIYKNGDRSNCNNYRGITLLSTAMKVFEVVIDRKIRAVTESSLEESQSGFRKGRSIQDHIFTVKQIIEKVAQHGRAVFMGFIDLKKAFDTVPRDRLWDILRDRGIDRKLIRMIKHIYRDNTNCVIQHGKTSEAFTTNEGLRQGGGLSPCLFTIFMDEIIRKCTSKAKKLGVGYRFLRRVEISEGAFADDIVVVAEKADDLQTNLEIWHATLKEFEMKLNKTKTKVMVIGQERKDLRIVIDGVPIEQVNHFKYLGVELEEDGRQEMEVNTRIEKTLKLYHLMSKNFIGRTEISTKTKINVFKAVYRPILTFGCESWVLNQKQKNRIQAIEMKYLRRTYGVTIMDKIRSQYIRDELEVDATLNYIERKQLAWWGHLQRMDDDRPTKQVWQAKAQKKKRRGRPRQTWDAAMVEVLNRREKTWVEAKELAGDRKEWARFVHGT